MSKKETLLEEIKKNRKSTDIKFMESLNKIDNYLDDLERERMIRLLSMAACFLLVLFGAWKGIEAESITKNAQGFSFRLDIYLFAALFLAAPYMKAALMAKFGDKKSDQE